MKLTAILLLIGILQAHARSVAQDKISLSVKNAPLEKVFRDIEKQSGYIVWCEKKLLDHAARVTLQLSNVPLEQALSECLKDQPLKFTIVGKTIVINLKDKVSEASANPEEPRLVKARGIIFNEAGQPLSGANIISKVTGKGTITNARGEFEILAPKNSILTVSFIGFAPQDIIVAEENKVQVYLKFAKNELDKVVVQAYGTTTQRLATGNIVTVTGEEIERQPVMNPILALEGKVAGLVVQQTSGYASAPVKIEIRGRSAIGNLPSDPLYIVDGVPLTILSTGTDNYASGSSGFLQNGFTGPASGQSPFFGINPSDIESITVLKDADATAIYGSRGASGVIIITTKKGKPGKTKFDVNVYSGINEVTRFYQLLNTPQYLSMRWEAFRNDYARLGLSPNSGNAYDLLVWDTTRSTDWQKFLWGGTGKTTDIEASFSGGDKQTTFRIGGGYHHEKGILSYSGADQRASLQFNLSHKSLNERLNISLTSMYSLTQSDLINLNGSVIFPPDAPPVFDKQGNLNFAGWAPVSQIYPFGNLLQPYTSKTGFLNSQLSLSYLLVKGLDFSTNFGYSFSHNSQYQEQPIKSQDPSTNPSGSAQFGNNNGTRAIVEPQLEYKGFVNKGKLTILMGGTLQSVSQDGNYIIGDGYTNDNLLHSISNARFKNASDAFGQYKYSAIFGRVTYNWEDKYILNLSSRRDGSSRFGTDKQFGNFYAVGTAWIFTEESWFKNNLPVLSLGKIRGSLGTTGSDNIGDYGYLTRWANQGVAYQGLGTYNPTQHANPNLQWQVNHELELAMDLGFFKDRIFVEISRYRNRVGNQLVVYPLPNLTGFSSVYANFPATVQNTGWEAILRGKIIDTKDISLSANLNISINRNKLLAFPNILQSPYAYNLFVGQPLNIVRLLHYTGVDPQKGTYTFLDKTKDGVINPYSGSTDDLFNKDLSVKYDGGFGTELRYNNLQIYLFFHFRTVDGQNAVYSSQVPGTLNNVSKETFNNHWQKPGDVGQLARFSNYGDQTDTYFSSSDGVYTDASFIRLRNVSITYTLPSSWAKGAGIRSCQIYVRGQNLFVITKYQGPDPESQSLGGLPPSKVFTGGIQFNF